MSKKCYFEIIKADKHKKSKEDLHISLKKTEDLELKLHESLLDNLILKDDVKKFKERDEFHSNSWRVARSEVVRLKLALKEVKKKERLRLLEERMNPHPEIVKMEGEVKNLKQQLGESLVRIFIY